MSAMEHIYNIIDQYPGDSLLPHSAVKDCIGALQADAESYPKQLAMLQGQIGMVDSDDTRMFSMQLTAAKLKEKLQAL